jgi:hypothetical protein
MFIKYTLLVVIVIFSLIGPLQYIVLKYFPPNGLEFNAYGVDDALFLTSMKSYEFGFQSPWVLSGDGVSGSIFLNPANGPVYLLVPLGAISFISGIDPLAVFLVFKFFSALLMLISAYYLIKCIVKDGRKADTIFWVFLLSAGFGGILVPVASILLGHSDILYPFTLFGFGVGAYRIADVYQSFAFAFSMIALIFLIRRRYIVSGLFLGAASLVYPPYAVAAFVSMALFSLFMKKTRLKHFLHVVMITAVFNLPWILAYFLQPYFFNAYSEIGMENSAHILISILLGFGMSFVFALYWFDKNLRKIKLTLATYKIYILSWFASLILLSFSNASYSMWVRGGLIGEYAEGMGLASLINGLRAYSTLLYVPFLLILIVTSVDILRNKKLIGKYNTFLILWFLAILFLVSIPIDINSRIPPKIVGFLALPVAFAAGEGIMNYCKSKKISIPKLIFIIFIMSIPSFVLFYSFEQSLARDVYGSDGLLKPQTFFYYSSDKNAMLYLKNLEPGVVIASGESGAFLPYYSNKKTLIFPYGTTNVVNFDEKEEDVALFFSNSSSADKRLKIIEKYNIRYIFYGFFEAKKYKPLSNLSFVKSIYENTTIIYEVGRNVSPS